MKILIVDDDPDLAEMLSCLLRRHQFSVVRAHDGRTALSLLRDERPDLVILDIMMPGMDGWQVCSEIRAKSAVPIIMLTVRKNEDDVARGLDMGADDYIAKPFAPRELLARVKAVARRSAQSSYSTLLESLSTEGVELNPANRRVVWWGRSVQLTPLEFRLLYELVRHEGQVLPHETLVDRVWGYQEAADSGLLKTHIHHLREKLEAQPAAPRHIVTVPGVGYTFQRAPTRLRKSGESGRPAESPDSVEHHGSYEDTYWSPATGSQT